MSRPVRIGISACLLGQKVRYNGGDKRAPSLLKAFGPIVEWVAVCPEVEIGLGVPREPIQLVRAGARAVRLRGARSRADHTVAMRRYAKQRLDELAALRLSGYILKSGSPSCGLRDVPVHDPDGPGPPRAGKGLFAAALLNRFPDLPIEEESRLADARCRKEFLQRVLAYAGRGSQAKAWNLRR